MLRTIVLATLLIFVLPGLGHAGAITLSGPGASVSVISTSDIIAGAAGSVFSEAGYRAGGTIEFFNGTGSGYFVPCLNVSNNQPSDGAAEFDTVYTETGLSAIGTCGYSDSGPFQTSNEIPFTFGIPQGYNLMLSAEAVPVDGYGSALAGIDGFVVLDASRNVLSNATWTVTDFSGTPEPSMLWPVCVALGLWCSRPWLSSLLVRNSQ
jgi:hypothetical protein